LHKNFNYVQKQNKMDSNTKIAIFASGSGTNAENIIRFFASSDEVKVALVLSNHADAGVHERARRLGVPSFTLSNSDFREGVKALELLARYEVGFIVLAGFMSLIPPALLQAFPRRIINIHPALLPKHGGKGMYGHHVHEAVIADGDAQSGITIHYVNERYDEGEIIFQAATPVLPDDVPDTLEARIHQLEHQHYPNVIKQLLER
jgi:phosphoribosylglycinamide formyltransferase-1